MGTSRLSPEAFSGVQVITSHTSFDSRGFIRRLYERNDPTSRNIDNRITHVNMVQISEVGTVKGLHLQSAPVQEEKLVACLLGRVWDVALDLRATSETYGKHFAIELHSREPISVLIPQGFAHGVQCLQRDSVMHYVHSAPYSPEHEVGVNALDPDLSINWPLPPVNLSERDRLLPFLKDLDY